MKLVILDRDGVINIDSDAYIRSPEEWHPIAGSLEAIARFTQANYKVFITTNQSGVGRGYYTLETMHAIHNKMLNALEKLGGKIEKIYYCPHLPDAGCRCRKPLPGMFEQLEQDYNVNLKELNPTYIGDSKRDYEVACTTGCNFILTIGEGGDGLETLHKLTAEQKQQIIIVENLAEAADQILSHENSTV